MTDVAHEWCLLVVILTLAAIVAWLAWLVAHSHRAATGGGGSGFRAQPLAKVS